MEEDSFCIFMFYESSKSLVLEERAELVASQLTQVIYFYTTYIFVFFGFEKISGGEKYLLRLHYSLTIFYHVISMLSLRG